MAKYEQEIFNLKQAIDYVGRSIDYEKEPNAPKVLNTALNLYHHYFELNKKLKRTPEFPEDVRIENDFHNFQRIVSGNDLKIIIGFFEEISQEKETEEKKQKTEPKKEESSVPSELESLVTQYKEAQANKVTEDSEHSIAETVKRARKRGKKNIFNN